MLANLLEFVFEKHQSNKCNDDTFFFAGHGLHVLILKVFMYVANLKENHLQRDGRSFIVSFFRLSTAYFVWYGKTCPVCVKVQCTPKLQSQWETGLELGVQ